MLNFSITILSRLPLSSISVHSHEEKVMVSIGLNIFKVKLESV